MRTTIDLTESNDYFNMLGGIMILSIGLLDHDPIDVVIITLFRKTLPASLKAIREVIPNSNVILVSSKGEMGELRNKGLDEVSTPIFAFVDDDVIINRAWFKEASTQIGNYDIVCGRYYPYFGLGACLCKTEALKKARFDHKFDGTILQKVNFKLLDVWCEHRDFHLVRHQISWLRRGFGYGRKDAFRYLIHSKDVYQLIAWAFTLICMLFRNPLRKVTA